MKNLIKKLSILCALIAPLAVHAGPLWSTLMNGYTSNSIAYDGTTWQVGTIAAATTPATPITNNFNLNIGVTPSTGWYYASTNGGTFTNAFINQTAFNASGGFLITGAQVNTNLLPVYAVNTYPGYPNTVYGPMSQIGVYAQVNLNASASFAHTFEIYWYQSIDGTNTPSGTPAFTQLVTVPSGAMQGSCISNFVTGGTPYLLIGQLINTNEVTGTNIVIEASGKAGL